MPSAPLGLSHWLVTPDPAEEAGEQAETSSGTRQGLALHSIRGGSSQRPWSYAWAGTGVSSQSLRKPGGGSQEGIWAWGWNLLSPNALPGSASRAWSPGPEAQGQLARQALPGAAWLSSGGGRGPPPGPPVRMEGTLTDSYSCAQVLWRGPSLTVTAAPRCSDTGFLISTLAPARRCQLLHSPFTGEALRSGEWNLFPGRPRRSCGQL